MGTLLQFLFEALKYFLEFSFNFLFKLFNGRSYCLLKVRKAVFSRFSILSGNFSYWLW